MLGDVGRRGLHWGWFAMQLEKGDQASWSGARWCLPKGLEPTYDVRLDVVYRDAPGWRQGKGWPRARNSMPCSHSGGPAIGPCGMKAGQHLLGLLLLGGGAVLGWPEGEGPPSLDFGLGPDKRKHKNN